MGEATDADPGPPAVAGGVVKNERDAYGGRLTQILYKIVATSGSNFNPDLRTIPSVGKEEI